MIAADPRHTGQEYRLGYYAVFFEDPDRLKLEIGHVPTAPPA